MHSHCSSAVAFWLCMRQVFVVSGRERDAVHAGLGDIKGLGIAAEHGLYYRWPKVREHAYSHAEACNCNRCCPLTSSNNSSSSSSSRDRRMLAHVCVQFSAQLPAAAWL